MMDVLFSWDYELFFGEEPGTVKNCIIKPTERLLEIADRNDAVFTFFIDIGHLVRAEELVGEHPELQKQINRITKQIKEIHHEGHDCQLHIHPHWEDAQFTNGRWVFDLGRYKLADFERDEADNIFRKYHDRLAGLIKDPPRAFRAGGWCIQPFDRFETGFHEKNYKIDSSVFPGGKAENEYYSYDFTKVSGNAFWRFDTDPVIENPRGRYIELPIASKEYSPLFFWKLFILGRLLPGKHKPIGDGVPASVKGTRKKFLTSYNTLSVSADGYFVTELKAAIGEWRQRGNQMVVLGHPKACTEFSLDYLDGFLRKNKNRYHFISFSQWLKKISG